MADILTRIVEHKRIEIARLKKEGLREPDVEIAPRRKFRECFVSGQDFVIIAEVKKASPSKGLICQDFDPLRLAVEYEEGGAGAVSVLTDENFFQGSITFLPMIRSQVSLPLLRKDFILDHIQIEQAKLWGADAVLLIVVCLDDVELAELYANACETGLDTLVEVHDMNEFERALKAGVDLVGVNNRNLRDFSVSLETTFQIVRVSGQGLPVISESGIGSREDIESLADAGVAGALIGESLVRSSDRRGKLRELLGTGE